MPIDRSGFNAWVDDDGSGTVGTVLDKATMAEDILDPIDEAIAAVEAGGGSPAPHHATHESGGTDPVTLAQSQITGLTTALTGKASSTHASTHAAGGSDPITAIAPTVITPLTGPAVVGRETGTGAAQSLTLGAGLTVSSGTVSATARASGVFNYQFNSSSFVEPPNDQTIRLNAGSPYTAVTKVWADFDSADSQDLYFGWMRISVGARLLIQDKDNHDQYAEFEVTAAPVDKGTYVELGVTHYAHGGTALGAQAVLVRLTTPASAPLTHHTSHETGGTDAIAALAGEVITTGTVAAARVAAGAGKRTVATSTATGSQNDWAPGLAGNSIVLWSGASDLTVTGLAGGAAGQEVTIRNTGSAVAYFANQSASSVAANRLRNLVTSGATPIAAGGSITYVHDGTDWKVIQHEQGDWISQPYSAGDFTANGSMTWTVASGDVETYRFRIVGRAMQLAFGVSSSTLGGTLNTTLIFAIPGGYTSAPYAIRGPLAGLQGANVGYSGSFLVIASTTTISVRNTGGQAVTWAASTDQTAVYMNATIPLT